jgi:hypothetical protein
MIFMSLVEQKENEIISLIDWILTAKHSELHKTLGLVADAQEALSFVDRFSDDGSALRAALTEAMLIRLKSKPRMDGL